MPLNIISLVPGAGIIVLYIYLSNIYYMLLGVDISSII